MDYGAERRGRIPGATHLYYGGLLREDGTFRDAAELESILARPDVRVYDGSWTEWGSIVGYPIER